MRLLHVSQNQPARRPTGRDGLLSPTSRTACFDHGCGLVNLSVRLQGDVPEIRRRSAGSWGDSYVHPDGWDSWLPAGGDIAGSLNTNRLAHDDSHVLPRITPSPPIQPAALPRTTIR